MSRIPLVTTIKERCRVCYTCVRECPAKAIRIASGQAEVVAERCIGCGNCVRVCSQGAKKILSSAEAVTAMLESNSPVAACIAPSFPAEFAGVDYRAFVGMVRALGFRHVHEVAFGADLVADRYRRMLEEHPDKRFIATSCPAIVSFIERYHPDLVGNLAPIVSPMVAMARVMRTMHDESERVVFIGPCIAKKAEADKDCEVDAALTYTELRELFKRKDITAEKAQPSDFDPPHGGAGALFPIARGLLHAADIHEDLIDGNVVAAEGRSRFVDAIREFESGDLNARLLEVLCCQGCIMGAGVTADEQLFRRRSRVGQYVRQRSELLDRGQWRREVAHFGPLDLSCRFNQYDQRLQIPFSEQMKAIMARMGKFTAEDELNCGACGYDTCRDHAIAIHKGLAESEMCLPYTIDQLRRTVKELAVSNEQLASVQEALVHSEKLASMGQLAAGIAHEVNNPLGVVLMYAHILLEECPQESRLHGDLNMVAEQADRCKKIVSGLLHFARQNKVVLQPTDVRELFDRVLSVLSIPKNIRVAVEHRLEDPIVEIDRDQIIQVLTNLVANAAAAMSEGGTLTLRTSGDEKTLRFSVIDTGIGIPKSNLSKIFEPFFTTKQIGQGTGLGLAVTYGIIKMHRGDIKVESNADPAAGATGTTFTVTLPRGGQQDEEHF